MFAAITLILATIAYRVAFTFSGVQADWANFSPLAAIAICCAAFFNRKTALIIPAAAIFFSDLLLNAHYNAALFDTGMFSRYFSFALVLLLGFRVRQQQRFQLLSLFLSTVIGSLIFYVITNTDAWLTLPGYSKTLAGWIQALTIGTPGYPPTYLFLRNTMASDLLFTALFVLTHRVFVRSAAKTIHQASTFTLN
jgi:hypothetical protein